MYQVTWSFSTFTYHQAEMLNCSFTQCEKTVTGLFTSVKSKFSVSFRSEFTTWIKNCYDGVYLEETISPETETLVQRARLRPEHSRSIGETRNVSAEPRFFINLSKSPHFELPFRRISFIFAFFAEHHANSTQVEQLELSKDMFIVLSNSCDKLKGSERRRDLRPSKPRPTTAGLETKTSGLHHSWRYIEKFLAPLPSLAETAAIYGCGILTHKKHFYVSTNSAVVRRSA